MSNWAIELMERDTLTKLFCGFVDGYRITPDDSNPTRFEGYD
jgi:hypothetical protein